MVVKAIFEHISKNEGVSIEDIAKNLDVAKSTIYYSINKNQLSLKLKKALKEVYPEYLNIIDNQTEESEGYDPVKVSDYVVSNEEELLKVDKFRLWLQTKVQDGVIEVLKPNDD